MKVVYHSAKTFADIFQTIGNIIDEGVIVVSPEKMYFSGMDPSRVMMVSFEANKSVFDKYDVEESEELPLNFSLLNKILKRGKKKDELILETRGDNILYVTLKGSATRTFKVPLVSGIESEKIGEVNIPFTARVDVMGNVMKDMIRDVKLVGDTVEFYSKEDLFRVYSKGISSEFILELGLEDDGLLDIEVEEESKSKYNLKYIESAFKKVNNTDSVRLKFGNDIPVDILWYPVNDIKVEFLIAPIVEE